MWRKDGFSGSSMPNNGFVKAMTKRKISYDADGQLVTF